MSVAAPAPPNPPPAPTRRLPRWLCGAFIAWYVFIGFLFFALLGNLLLIPLAFKPNDWWPAVQSQFANVIGVATSYPLATAIVGLVMVFLTGLARLAQLEIAAEKAARLREERDQTTAALHQEMDEQHHQHLEHIDAVLEEKVGSKGKPARTGPVTYLPVDRLPGYIERAEVVEQLREKLTGADAVIGLAAVTGQGGLGKTVLARVICDDPAIKAHFPDGILWGTLGKDAQEAEVLQRQRDWIHVLGGDEGAADNLPSGKVELQRLLADREMLLVLDDVWQAKQLTPLLVGGARCKTLVTTRYSNEVPGAIIIPLDLMTPAESHALLRAASQRPLDDALAEAIAARVGHLPLMLSLVGNLLRKDIPWPEIHAKLDAHALAFFAYPGMENVFAVLATSLDYLGDPAKIDRYLELVIFPPKEPLLPSVVARLWRQTAGMDLIDSRVLFAEFLDASLIQGSRVIHDLQLDFLRARAPAATQQVWHGQLADGYGPVATWAQLPDDEGDQQYGWRMAASHLHEAGRMADLRQVLTDGSYLQEKMRRFGVGAVLSDLALLGDDATLRALAVVIRSGAIVLGEDPTEVWNQAQGRAGMGDALHATLLRPVPRFDLRFPTMLPADEALVRVFAGHTSDVRGCAFSADSQLALSASADGTLRLWDMASGATVRVYDGHTSFVTGCAISPDGQQALSASVDGTLRLWDLASGATVRVFVGHTSFVTGCAISPDGQRALSASGDATLRLWDVASGETVRVFVGHKGAVRACAFSSNGQQALSASWDQTLRLWDVATGVTVQVFAGHTQSVNGCAFSPNGQQALSASNDGTLRLWDVESGATVRVFAGHTGAVLGCAFSPNNQQVLSASDDGKLRLWDVASGATMRVFAGHTGAVLGCAYSANGQQALSASGDGKMGLWDIPSGVTVRAFAGHTEAVNGCAFSADGQQALSASYDGTLRLWDVASGATMRVFAGHTEAVLGCAWASNGRQVLSASLDNTLRLWDVASGATVRVFAGHTEAVNGCAFSADGQQVLSASWDQTLRLWNVASTSTMRVFAGHTESVDGCAFSADGQQVLSASWDQTLRLWNVASEATVRIFAGHIGDVLGCALGPFGQQALSASTDGTLRLWDIASGATVRVFAGHTGDVYGCAFSPDGQQALSVSGDRTLRLWDVASGRELGRWTTDTGLSCCAFAPDGRMVIAGDMVGGLHFLTIVTH